MGKQRKGEKCPDTGGKEVVSSYGDSKLQALTDFFGKAQSISFKGETNKSVPDNDGSKAKAE